MSAALERVSSPSLQISGEQSFAGSLMTLFPVFVASFSFVLCCIGVKLVWRMVSIPPFDVLLNRFFPFDHSLTSILHGLSVFSTCFFSFQPL